MAGGNPYPNREYPPGLFDDDGPINQTLIAINEWNPLANAVNGIKGFFTGTDINGRAMSGLEPGMTLAGAIPFVKFGKVGVNFVKGGIQYTKSSLALGRQVHSGYKVAEHAPALGRFKEFTGIKGIRPDFVDFGARTIYELKPYNPRGIRLGKKQLNNYKSIFEQNYGGEWKTVLDFY